jgi:prolyl oligopeptidase
MLTDRAAPRRRIVVADPDDDKFPSAESWHELIDQDDHAVIEDFAILDGDDLGEPQIVVARRRHAISELTVHHLTSGKQLNAVELPGLGSVDSLHERPEGGHQAWFAYADYAHPGRVLHYDAVTSGTDVWSKPPGAIEVPAITTRQVAYESADGTTIRMVVISAGAEADDGQADNHVPRSARPAILYGYGGFNVSLTPAFAASILAWVEAGGLYAIAGLRGGSEEGEQWHRAGMREHKQNVFDDFHAAAEKLIKDGWTTADQLAVWGGSNGGLLVGASVTQRPELKAAAVCSAPLLDMVRYELFGLGETWNDEFGTAAKPDELEWLLSYSPYHHVRPGVRYPAVLFAAFDGDTRVDPLHARKMCAAMQYATAAPPEQRPILLRREANVGHGQRAISRTVGMTAEMLAFVAAQTGLEI